MLTKMPGALPVLAAFLTVAFYSTSSDAGKPVPEPIDCIPVVPVVPVEKTFYLTTSNYSAVEAPTACAEGYHFASQSEFMTNGSMTYNIDLGYHTPQTGYGAPFAESGWVNSGDTNSNIHTNCLGWTSVDELHKGMRLYFADALLPSAYLDQPPTQTTLAIHTYQESCAAIMRVWCISDPIY